MRPVWYKVMLLKEHLPGRADLDSGGKVVIPESYLARYLTLLQLRNKDMPNPLLFRLTAAKSGMSIHCGSLEFTAPEGRVCLPGWMLPHLGLEVADSVEVAVAPDLPKAREATFRPGQGDLLKLDQKVLLERHLRGFSALTEGDVIPVAFGERHLYSLEVVQVDPSPAACIVDCDVRINFLPAKDQQQQDEKAAPGKTSVGRSINGETEAVSVKVERGQPDYHWKPTELKFIRPNQREEDQARKSPLTRPRKSA